MATRSKDLKESGGRQQLGFPQAPPTVFKIPMVITQEANLGLCHILSIQVLVPKEADHTLMVVHMENNMLMKKTSIHTLNSSHLKSQGYIGKKK